MSIFISFCGTRTEPVQRCFDYLYNSDREIEKVYLLYKDYPDKDGYRSVEACENLARRIWETYYPDNYKNPIMPRGDKDKIYGNAEKDHVYTHFMKSGKNKGELDEDFQLDKVIDLIIRISAENKNQKIYLNVTNGNKVFTCAMAIAAHMLGASMCYVDDKSEHGKDVRIIKDCEAPAPDKLGVTEKRIMKAIGEIYAQHERRYLEEPKDPITYKEYTNNKQQADVDSEPEHTVSGESSLEHSIRPNKEFYILQKEISDPTKSWSKDLSASLVSANIHKLQEKHLIEIFDACSPKTGKISNKYNAIRLTVQGRLVVSRL